MLSAVLPSPFNFTLKKLLPVHPLVSVTCIVYVPAYNDEIVNESVVSVVVAVL